MMKMLMTVAAAATLMAAPVFAADAPGQTVKPAFSNPIANIPGKTLTAVVVTYAPGGKTPSHIHAKSAFITGYVLSGAIRSQLNDGEIKIFHAGESFVEVPGTRHTISENASETEPASLLAVFVVDTDEKELTKLAK